MKTTDQPTAPQPCKRCNGNGYLITKRGQPRCPKCLGLPR